MIVKLHNTDIETYKLPIERVRKLRMYYPKESRVRYIDSVLSENDLRNIDSSKEFNEGDYIIFARTKRATGKQLRHANGYLLNDVYHYMHTENEWFKVGLKALEIQLGRNPTMPELKSSLFSEENCIRFRMFYALKHPNIVKHD